MNKILLLLCTVALVAGCKFSAGSSADKEMDRFVSELMSQMTLEEKLGQLNLPTLGGGFQTGAAVNSEVEQKIAGGQVGGLLNISNPQTLYERQKIAVEQSRLGIPLIFGMDVIHGHRTVFPIPLGMAATWDMDLIERTAQAAAFEASSEGVSWTFSPMVDISRDPRWGRVAEGGGEDAYLGSLISAAMVRGYQGDDMRDPNSLMACVKHFALYGAPEGGRDYNTVDMSLIRMYQEYFPPYKAAVDAGVGSAMTSFNDINGVPATANHWLLTELLRDDWGFNGFVVTDYTAINELIAHGLGNLQTVSALALKAGVDMDMVGEGFLTTLKQSLEEGKVSQGDIDLACRRMLEAKYKLGLFEDPYSRLPNQGQAERVIKPEIQELALEAARKAVVLLKNDGVLPLRKGNNIVLTGPLADSRRDMHGTWAMAGDAERTVSIREGLEQYGHVTYTMGAPVTDDAVLAAGISYRRDQYPSTRSMLSEAIAASRGSEVVIAVMGETSNMNGEAASRTDIGLPESQRQLLEALVNAGKKVVLVLINGRPLTLEWEHENCAAIVEAWAPGAQGGNALAQILFGDYNPQGKLTMTFPRNVGQIPIYYNMKPTGRPYDGGNKFTSKYLDSPNEPLYPFGYGLNYSELEYSGITTSKTTLKGNETLTASVTLTNKGDYTAVETVQLYIGDPVASISRPVKELKGFKKVEIHPGESKRVDFEITTEQLSFFNPSLEYIWEPGVFVIELGGDSVNTLKTEVEWNK